MRELYFLWTLWVLKTSAFTMRAFDLITIYIFDAGQGRVAKPNLQQRKKKLPPDLRVFLDIMFDDRWHPQSVWPSVLSSDLTSTGPGHNIQRLQVQGVLWSRQDENNGREILFSLGRTASQKTEVWDILAGRSRRSWPRQNLHHCSEPCWWNNNIFNLLR